MRIRPLLLLIPIATALLYACGGTGTPPAPHTIDADVVLEGDVTDETFVAMKSAIDQGQPASSPAKSATIEEPADGASVPRATAPMFMQTSLRGALERTAEADARARRAFTVSFVGAGVGLIGMLFAVIAMIKKSSSPT